MFINSFFRALQAEYIKTKASGLKWLCLGASLFIPLLRTIGKLVFPDDDLGGGAEKPWMGFIGACLSNFGTGNLSFALSEKGISPYNAVAVSNAFASIILEMPE